MFRKWPGNDSLCPVEKKYQDIQQKKQFTQGTPYQDIRCLTVNL